MYIIGVTGTIGAGKGAIVESLKKRGFVHYSARDFILEEVDRRGLPHNRDTTTHVANDLRTQYSPEHIIKSLYEKAVEHGQNAVIESVRALGELSFLKSKPHFFLFAIDADPHVRYERVIGRKSKLDSVTFDEFVVHEKREMSSKNPNEGSISDCMKQADVHFVNNGSKDDLDIKIGEALSKIVPM